MDATENTAAVEAETHVLMLVKSGENGDIRWFTYRPTYFGEIIRVEWEADTMIAPLPTEYATYLISNGYARALSDEEIEAYTAPPAEEPVVVAPSPKPNKGKGEKS